MPEAHHYAVLWVPESEPERPTACDGCGCMIQGLQWELWCVVDGLPTEPAIDHGAKTVICPACHFVSG